MTRRSFINFTACRRALTLVEAVAAMAIAGMVMVAALRASSGAGTTQATTADRATGRYLAESLMTEILQQDYRDSGPLPLFGPEAGELLSSRSAFDDVDDYNGWSESPPRDKAGNALSGVSNWSRNVSVVWVAANNPGQGSLVETGAKRITVTVKKNSITVATLIAIKADAP